MSGVDERVIDKIRKLLALATSPNEHEAASAAAKAQALMLEHDLASDDITAKVDKRTAGIDRTSHELRKRGKPGNWKIALYEAVALTSDCYVWVSDTHGQMIGRKQDMEMAEYLFAYLVVQLERLQDEYGKERWAELRDFAKAQGISTHDAEREYKWAGTHPLRAKDSWMRGAVPVVIRTLTQRKRDRDQQVAGASALVISKKHAIDDYLAQQRGYKDRADYDAQMAARRAEREAEGTAVVKPLTAAQQRKEQERAERYWERERRKEETRRRKEYERTDWRAYERGQSDGRRVGIHEGLKGG